MNANIHLLLFSMTTNQLGVPIPTKGFDRRLILFNELPLVPLFNSNEDQFNLYLMLLIKRELHNHTHHLTPQVMDRRAVRISFNLKTRFYK